MLWECKSPFAIYTLAFFFQMSHKYQRVWVSPATLEFAKTPPLVALNETANFKVRYVKFYYRRLASERCWRTRRFHEPKEIEGLCLMQLALLTKARFKTHITA